MASQWETDIARRNAAEAEVLALRDALAAATARTATFEASAISGFMPGLVRPDKTNTGCDDRPKTAVAVPMTYSTPQVVWNTRFEDWVSVTSPGVIFINCEGVGPLANPTASRGVFHASNAAAAPTFIRCTVRPRQPHRLLSGIYGHHATTIACNISGVVDGFGISNGTSDGGWRDYGSWIHDLFWFAPDPAHSDGHTHNDCIQFHTTARNNQFYGTRLTATIDQSISALGAPPLALSCVMANVSNPADVLFDRVWAENGDSLYNFGPTLTGTGNGFVIRNGVNDWQSSRLDVNVFAKAGLAITLAGNVDASGSPANMRTPS